MNAIGFARLACRFMLPRKTRDKSSRVAKAPKHRRRRSRVYSEWPARGFNNNGEIHNYISALFSLGGIVLVTWGHRYRARYLDSYSLTYTWGCTRCTHLGKRQYYWTRWRRTGAVDSNSDNMYRCANLSHSSSWIIGACF